MEGLGTQKPFVHQMPGAMADQAMSKIATDACNMSRVNMEQKLATVCVNGTSPQPSACDRIAHGISLSTPITMTTFGVLGNVLALIVLYASRREAHARRTVFFVMLSGLAWTDLMGLLAVSPIAIITYANNLKWVGGVPLCRYHGFMMVSFGVVMPLIVCCMSVERFLAIKFSYYYARHITRRKAQLTFLACWAVTTSFTAMPFVGFGSYERQYPGSWCFLNFHRESKTDTIYAAMFSCLNIVAIVIMIMCNLIVAGTLFRVRLRRQFHSSPSTNRKLSFSGISSSTSGTVIRQKHHSDMEAQMIWFLCLITIAFSVCWLPLNVHILLVQFTGKNNLVLDLQFIRMVSCNQILDPWLYVIFRKNSLLRIIRQVRSCCWASQEPAKSSHVKPPSMRYVMSNRSFYCEATTAGRTLAGGPRRNNFPTSCEDSLRKCDGGVGQSYCNGGSSNSVTALVSSCPYCDGGDCCSEKDSRHVNVSPQGLSLAVLPVNIAKWSYSDNVDNRQTCQQCIRHDKPETSQSALTAQCFSNWQQHIKRQDNSHITSYEEIHRNNKITDNCCSKDLIYITLTSPVKDIYTQQVSLITPTRSISLPESTNQSQVKSLPALLPEKRIPLQRLSFDRYLRLSPPLASPEQLHDTLSQISSLDHICTDFHQECASTCCDNILHSVESGGGLNELLGKCYNVSDLVNQCDTNEANDSSILSPCTATSLASNMIERKHVITSEFSECQKRETSLATKSKNSVAFENHKQNQSLKPSINSKKDNSRKLVHFDTCDPVIVKLGLSQSKIVAIPTVAESDMTNKSHDGSTSDLNENKLDSIRCLLQKTDHTDHIKCFKSRKTPLLERNGTECSPIRNKHAL